MSGDRKRQCAGGAEPAPHALLHHGLWRDRPQQRPPAYDSVGLALSGISSLLLDPEKPQVCGPTIPDNATGMYACYGVLGALYERERTGKGRLVELNMMEAAISFIPDPFANYTLLGIDNNPLTRVASSHSFAVPCADGKLLAIHLSSQTKFWEGLLRAIERMDLNDDPRFANREARIAHFTVLTEVLASVFVTRDRAAWMALLEAQDVPFAPIHSIPEVIADPQVQHLESFRTLHHPTLGDLLTIRRPVRIDGGRDGSDLAAPVLGEHTDAVLAELGYSDSDIAAKRAAKII